MLLIALMNTKNEQIKCLRFDDRNMECHRCNCVALVFNSTIVLSFFLLGPLTFITDPWTITERSLTSNKLIINALASKTGAFQCMQTWKLKFGKPALGRSNNLSNHYESKQQNRGKKNLGMQWANTAKNWPDGQQLEANVWLHLPFTCRNKYSK